MLSVRVDTPAPPFGRPRDLLRQLGRLNDADQWKYALGAAYKLAG